MSKVKDRPIPPTLKKFLRSFAALGKIKAAARAAGIDWSTHYYWLANDKYRRLFDRAHKRAGYPKQEKLDELATIGQPKFHNGEQVFCYFDADGKAAPREECLADKGKLKPKCRREPVMEINVTALIFALKAAFPDKYRERREVKHTGIVKTDPVNEQVKKILEDGRTLELANALARRMAQHAGGNGQSAN